MDTESIAREIVTIKNRLQELESQVEGADDTDVDDERKELVDRMRHLQDLFSTHGAGDNVKQDEPGSPDDVQYVRPA
ncbi:MAG TPA: hypothetical protein VF148_04985 [Acidimicrobiia bacterium]